MLFLLSDPGVNQKAERIYTHPACCVCVPDMTAGQACGPFFIEMNTEITGVRVSKQRAHN